MYTVIDLCHIFKPYGVAEVVIMVQINASFGKIWNIISNVDNDQNYWKEITRIRNISKNRNVVTREVRLSNGSKCQQKISLFPKEGIHVQWTKGPIIGIKDIMLIDYGETTIIRIQINYKLKDGLGGPVDVLKELRTEAEYALQAIKRQAECKQDGITKQNRK